MISHKEKGLVLVTALTAAFALAGCGTAKDNLISLDSNKETIVLECYYGGFGEEWMVNLINKFNAANDKYQITMTKANVNGAGVHLTALESGTCNIDVFFSGESYYQKGFYRDYFEDLSDLLTEKPDGDSGLTVQEKILDADTWLAAGKKNGSGCYMLPNTTTLMGLVFDYDLFLENGWLSYASVNDKAAIEAQGLSVRESNGQLLFVSYSGSGSCTYSVDDAVLTPGKDGLYGTYDDGEPTTWSDFDAMLNSINSAGYTPLAYSGQVGQCYLDDMVKTYLAQYLGADRFNQYLDYDTAGEKIKLVDADGVTSEEAISPKENGYKAYWTDGMNQTMDFIKKYFYSTNYCSNTCMQGTSQTVNDVQMTFLQSYALTNRDKKYAMIIEGNWWENEATSAFASVAKRDPSRAKGKREYRYMMLPAIEGQNTTKNVMTSLETGGLLVKKQTDPNRLAAIKQFILSTLTNDALAETCSISGLSRPYKFTMTSAQYDAMTPFQKTVYTIAQDSAHTDIVHPFIKKASVPVTFASSNAYVGSIVPFGASGSAIGALRAYSGNVSQIEKNIKTAISAADWQTAISECRASGFYN